MNRSFPQIIARLFCASTVLLAGAISLGCESNVDTGDGGDGGSGGGASTSTSTSSSSSGGEVVCWKDFGPDAPGECTIGETRDCTPPGSMGIQDYCIEKCVNIDGKAVWGLKSHDFQCPFYESSYHINGSPQCACNTPLVLSFDRTPVEFTAAKASYAFNLTATGKSIITDWPTARTPWLALDRDGDGAINGGGELFGSATRLAGGGVAQNGFIALRELDANGDGKITAEDPGFAKLLLWSDRDGDRSSVRSELATAASAELVSIDLDYTSVPKCDDRGNCEVERASFNYRDEAGALRTGAIIDVHLSEH